jgi:hypothetical protein
MEASKAAETKRTAKPFDKLLDDQGRHVIGLYIEPIDDDYHKDMAHHIETLCKKPKRQSSSQYSSCLKLQS